MKKTFRSINGSLARRLSAYVILVSTFIAIFTSAIQIYTEYKREVKSLHSGLEHIEQTHLSNISSRLWVLDNKELKSTLESLLSLPSVKYIAVYDNNKLFLDVGENTGINVVERNYELFYNHNHKKVRLGTLTVKASLEDAYKHIVDRAIIIFSSNAIKTFIVAGMILFIFYRLVATHLHKIAEFAQQLDIDTLDQTFEFERKKNPENFQDDLDLIKTALSKMQHNLTRAIKKLQKSEQDLAITLNSIGDAVITTDATGRVTRMNPIAEQLTGWSLQEANGQPLNHVFKIINTLTQEAVENPIDKVLASGKTVSLSNHTSLIAKDGARFQIDDSASPIRNNDQILGVVLVFNDVTEEYRLREEAKSVQLALQNKEKDQREILNSMVDGVITIDETGKIISFNKTAEILFGYRYDEIINQNVNRLMPETDAIKHDGYLQRYLKSGEAHIIGTGREVLGKRKNNDTFPMRLSIAALPMDETKKMRFIGSCHDLSYLKQQEQQLRNSQKMETLGQLTGGIAHDYNNMLGVILGYSELLKEMLKDQPKLEKYVDQIHHAGERGTKLTKKLLSFSRNHSTESRKININKLLEEQQDMLQKTLTVRIKLLFDLANEIWPIWMDSSELEDSILNMSINAMHAMNKNILDAQLTIRSRNETLNSRDAGALNLNAGDYVQLSIIDTGSGMDKSTIDKIFDPFFSTKGKQGTGLGLSQVFNFVKRAGGTIKVNSKPGHGSTFIIYFPRYRENEIENNRQTDEKEINVKGQEKILIVDDEAALRNLASELLEQQNYRTYCAADAKEALQILEHEHIDLMLSDIVMPGVDGYELAAIVLDNYPKIKIQLASGYTDEQHMHMIDSKLHTNRLNKPYKAKELLHKVRELLDEK